MSAEGGIGTGDLFIGGNALVRWMQAYLIHHQLLARYPKEPYLACPLPYRSASAFGSKGPALRQLLHLHSRRKHTPDVEQDQITVI
jgi:hypothetical protein